MIQEMAEVGHAYLVDTLGRARRYIAGVITVILHWHLSKNKVWSIFQMSIASSTWCDMRRLKGVLELKLRLNSERNRCTAATSHLL